MCMDVPPLCMRDVFGKLMYFSSMNFFLAEDQGQFDLLSSHFRHIMTLFNLRIEH